jgi:hypothetical protein
MVNVPATAFRGNGSERGTQNFSLDFFAAVPDLKRNAAEARPRPRSGRDAGNSGFAEANAWSVYPIALIRAERRESFRSAVLR